MGLSFRGKAIGFAILGVVLAAAGGGLIPFFKNMIRTTIEQSVAITSTSDAFSAWKQAPVPIHMQFYLFAVANPAEVLNGGQPYVIQKGPYTYREYRLKENIEWYENNTVAYDERRWFVFDRNMSVGGEDDVLLSVNVPLVTVATLVKYKSEIVQSLVKDVIEAAGDEGLFVNHTVGEWLWGYEDPLLQDVKKVLERFGIPAPDDHFGFFYGQNNSNDGNYLIYTGQDDPSMTAHLDRWNGMLELPYWSTNSSNMLNGTDGTMFGPYTTRDQTLYLYSTDICRSIYAVYDHDTSSFGIDLLRFVPPPEVFWNSTANPANAGYCTPNCLGSGVLNVSNCQKGAPIIVSQPHFLNSAQKYIDAVQGMHPADEMNTYVDVEPMTGAAFNAQKKLQINIYMQPFPFVDDLKNVRTIIFPLMFVNESAFLDEPNANDFKKLVLNNIRLTYAVQYGLMAIGAVILLTTALISLMRCRAKSEDEMPIMTSSLNDN